MKRRGAFVYLVKMRLKNSEENLPQQKSKQIMEDPYQI